MDYRGRTDIARGIRNNNPGNIKDDGTLWQGRVGSDGVFNIFQDTSWGIRALATDLSNKVKSGNDTIRKIVYKYAPPSENQTEAYVKAVAASTGIGADQIIPITGDTLHDLVRAVIDHENGSEDSQAYVSDVDIDSGIAMMKPSLIQFFQAAGIAARSSVIDQDGAAKWGNILVVAGIISVIVYAKSKK